MTKFAAALLLAANTANAQAWRADLESGQDGLGLAVVVCAAIAYFYVQGEFKRSANHGNAALAIVVGIALAALFYPPARAILAIITLVFLVYGLFNRS